MSNNNTLNLSSIKYDENGNIQFQSNENAANLQIVPQIPLDYPMGTPQPYINPTENPNNSNSFILNINEIPMQTNEKIQSMPPIQSIEEMEAEIEREKRRERKENSVIYLSDFNIMFISGLMFVIFGLALGTFVFEDYITFTLGGLFTGLIVGKVLCYYNDKNDDSENKNDVDGEKSNQD